jgi:hypothetical protein
MNRRTVLRGAVGVSAAAVAATITKVSKATYDDPAEAYRNFDNDAHEALVPKVAGPWVQKYWYVEYDCDRVTALSSPYWVRHSPTGEWAAYVQEHKSGTVEAVEMYMLPDDEIIREQQYSPRIGDKKPVERPRVHPSVATREEADAVLRAHGWTLLESL